MVGVLITGHGNFATGLKTSVELIAGASDYFKYVDFRVILQKSLLQISTKHSMN